MYARVHCVSARFLTVALLLLAGMWNSSSASAAVLPAPLQGGNSDCPHGGNYASVGCLLYVTNYGVLAYWQNNSMYVTPEKLAQGYHVNHTLWDYSGVPCSSWVEIGLTYGYHGSPGYHYYEAIKRYGSGAYADYEISSTSNDGSTHSYLVYYYSSSPIEWVAYLDGYQRGVFTSGSDQGDLGYGACIGEAGLEGSAQFPGSPPDATWNSATFDLSPLEYYDTSRQTIIGGWNANWIDYPCGSPPSCLNGTFYGSSHWADNKP